MMMVVFELIEVAALSVELYDERLPACHRLLTVEVGEEQLVVGVGHALVGCCSPASCPWHVAEVSTCPLLSVPLAELDREGCLRVLGCPCLGYREENIDFRHLINPILYANITRAASKMSRTRIPT